MEQASYPTVSVSLTVKDASKALAFYAEALGAEELYRMAAPDGSVVHAEFKVGNAHIFISGEYPEWQALAMPEGATASCLFSVFAENCDQSFNRAVQAGATPIYEPQNNFWGTRSGLVRDPFGYRWSFNQKIEDLSPEEIEKRARDLSAA